MIKIIRYSLIALGCVTFSAFVCVLVAALLIGKVLAALIPMCLFVAFAMVWLVLSILPFVKRLVGFKIGVVGVCIVVAALILIF